MDDVLVLYRTAAVLWHVAPQNVCVGGRRTVALCKCQARLVVFDGPRLLLVHGFVVTSESLPDRVIDPTVRARGLCQDCRVTTSADLTVDTRYSVIVTSVSPECM